MTQQELIVHNALIHLDEVSDVNIATIPMQRPLFIFFYFFFSYQALNPVKLVTLQSRSICLSCLKWLSKELQVVAPSALL